MRIYRYTMTGYVREVIEVSIVVVLFVVFLVLAGLASP